MDGGPATGGDWFAVARIPFPGCGRVRYTVLGTPREKSSPLDADHLGILSPEPLSPEPPVPGTLSPEPRYTVPGTPVPGTLSPEFPRNSCPRNSPLSPELPCPRNSLSPELPELLSPELLPELTVPGTQAACSIIPLVAAIHSRTAPTAFCTPSLAIRLARWISTVRGLICLDRAISLLDIPQ